MMLNEKKSKKKYRCIMNGTFKSVSKDTHIQEKQTNKQKKC